MFWDIDTNFAFKLYPSIAVILFNKKQVAPNVLIQEKKECTHQREKILDLIKLPVRFISHLSLFLLLMRRNGKNIQANLSKKLVLFVIQWNRKVLCLAPKCDLTSQLKPQRKLFKTLYHFNKFFSLCQTEVCSKKKKVTQHGVYGLQLRK